ncbi:hypothetical protein F7725_026160 [Dissostichus mawsoni]|uniref:Uncharacterized protein n=1 Tax=Dissostichus mawsoni TaxID=36200 RepID=A0A7J5X6D2_DISMA|nr:hypothetical protein F7725_026160 [Dissostichus mawsoni]
MLQSYIQSSLKDIQGGPEISTWEQEVFFLFGLYDFDRSELLDGLEMMKLLSDYNSHHTPGAKTNVLVVSMVDFYSDSRSKPGRPVGPVGAAVSFLTSHTGLQQQQSSRGEAVKPRTDEEAGGAEQREEAQQEVQLQDEDKPQQEVKTEEEELIIKWKNSKDNKSQKPQLQNMGRSTKSPFIRDNQRCEHTNCGPQDFC